MPKDAERSPIILPPESEIKGELEQNPALQVHVQKDAGLAYWFHLLLSHWQYL